MSTTKLSFRARALDAAKPMAVFKAHELPDLPDFTVINRAVPQMPTGMEKEEETEHHLQRAIVTGLIIPTPEVFQVNELGCYNRCYPGEWKVPRNLIHMQPFTMEQDIPDYDMDSDDEKWIDSQADKFEITPLQFEEMMDRLEKSSGQTVVTLAEAKSLLKIDDDFIVVVYDYWLNKRLKILSPLIPQVKSEKFGGTGSSGNPYIAFRRRTEKMQTRKHRKNDEASYEKMLKLRRDLSRALTLLEMVKKREKFKREVVHFGIEVYEKRYQLSDYSGHIINEVNAQVKQQPRPSTTPLSTIQNSNLWPNLVPPVPGNISSLQTGRGRSFKDELLIRKEKRNYRKRRHKASSRGTSTSLSGMLNSMPATVSGLTSCTRGPNCFSDAPSISSEDEIESAVAASLSDIDEVEADFEKQGPFVFRRKQHCNYLAPNCVASPYPFYGADEGGLADSRFRFCLTSLISPQRRCVGFARRRIGRGGRVILDRAYSALDDAWDSLHDRPGGRLLSSELKEEIRSSWKHFSPASTIEPSLDVSVDKACISLNNDLASDSVSWISISTNAEETGEQQSLDFDLTNYGLDGFKIPVIAVSPPHITSSNFNVIGDTVSTADAEGIDLDWWNYFDNATSDVLAKNPELQESVDSKAHVHVNGVNSPSITSDSHYWKIPKSSSLPNIGCSIKSPCLGELHTPEVKDQTNQSVADFLSIDSTFAMEVT